jgi:membrane protease YdiL (CAAX protease family)
MRPQNFKITFTIICLLSIGLIVIADNLAVQFLKVVAPDFIFLGQIRLVSLIICFGLFRYAHTETNDDQLPVADWKKVVRISMIWLIPTAYLVLVMHVWVPPLSGWIDITSFMITGLLAEEFLFRGCIYELANKVFPRFRIWKFSAAILISAIFFGLQHLAYHHFHFTSAAVVQISYTFLMGLFFASVRETSGRLWPVIALHFITNLFTLIRLF